MLFPLSYCCGCCCCCCWRMNEWMNWMAKRHNLWHNLAPFPNRVTISILLFIKIVNTIKRWIGLDTVNKVNIARLFDSFWNLLFVSAKPSRCFIQTEIKWMTSTFMVNMKQDQLMLKLMLRFDVVKGSCLS